MARQPRHSNPPKTRPLFERTVAVLVLVGYLFVLYGSSVGHGWQLLIHLVDKHQTEAAAAEEGKILRTLNPDRLPKAHTHGGETHHHGADATHAHEAVPAQSDDAWSTAHEHDGVVHTHERPADLDETLIVLLLLDQQYLFAASYTPLPPPARDTDFAYVPATFPDLSFSVETPPPRPVA